MTAEKSCNQCRCFDSCLNAGIVTSLTVTINTTLTLFHKLKTPNIAQLLDFKAFVSCHK